MLWGPLAMPERQPRRPHCPVSGCGSCSQGSVPIQPPFTLVIAHHRASARAAVDFSHQGQLCPTPPATAMQMPGMKCEDRNKQT